MQVNHESQPDWDHVEKEVVLRIRCLKAAWGENPPNPTQAKIRDDLIVPAMRYLGVFCEIVSVK